MVTSTPEQLPLVPRPIPHELFSSWLLRVAAANCVSLQELLDALRSRHPDVPYAPSLDVCVPAPLMQAISLFCRIPLKKIEPLDLRQRLPHLQRALVMRFPRVLLRCGRQREQRLGYAICLLCLSEQRTVHVPWEWCLASLIRCSVHKTALQVGCPNCGESDPLSFTVPDAPPNNAAACWYCGQELCSRRDLSSEIEDRDSVHVIEEAYRAALLGVAPNPTLLGKATARAFRTFIDDMVQVSVEYTGSRSNRQRAHAGAFAGVARQQMLSVIAGLVVNAMPSSDQQQQRLRYRRSQTLWSTLLPLIPGDVGERLEEGSRLWPPALSRRLVSALLDRRRKRWPYSPFKTSACFPLSEFVEVVAIRNPTPQHQRSTRE